RLFLWHAADARGLPELALGRLSVLPVRLRYPGARCSRCGADDGRAGARSEATAGVSRWVWTAAAFRGGGPHWQSERLYAGWQQFGEADLGTVGVRPRGCRRGADLRRVFGLCDLWAGVVWVLSRG